MTPLLICAAVVAAFYGAAMFDEHGRQMTAHPDVRSRYGAFGLALIAVALWLAYAAEGRA